MSKLKVAISQFPVSSDIEKNTNFIINQMDQASSKNADVIHFPETALSGYDTKLDSDQWSLLDTSLSQIRKAAKKLNLYVVLGSHYQDKLNLKPLNCTYLISDQGKIEGKYFKNQQNMTILILRIL